MQKATEGWSPARPCDGNDAYQSIVSDTDAPDRAGARASRVRTGSRARSPARPRLRPRRPIDWRRHRRWTTSHPRYAWAHAAMKARDADLGAALLFSCLKPKAHRASA